jgi:kynurenine formamidase
MRGTPKTAVFAVAGTAVVLLAGAAVVRRAAAAPAKPSGPPLLDLSRARLVDLSHAFDDKTLYWPNSPSRFELKRLAYGQTPGGYFYASYSLCTPEHGGTHLDAPIHFAEGRWTAEQIPVERLVGPAVVLDVTRQAKSDRDYRLTTADVEAWEKANGTIPAGSIVLLRTGWAERWPDALRYLGDNTPGETTKLHFPSYGPEAAALLVDKRKVIALGVDTASIDAGPSADFQVHRLAMQANVYGLENLADLSSLPARGSWLIALPMKIAGGSGGPLRVVALVPR